MELLLNALKQVEHLANASKLRRFVVNPFKYSRAILFRQMVYPITGKPNYIKCLTFYKAPFTVALPAGTDIYLTGGKSHDSEIRLARFLIKQLKTGDQFLDIGAHFGYFSQLAAHLVGSTGKVLAFEASPENFNLLQQNTYNYNQVTCLNQAVSDQVGELTFYQFPAQYSEYNSRNVDQYQLEAWFKNNTPEKITVPAITIDHLVQQQLLQPSILKIDVEGGEYPVILGGKQTFTSRSPLVVMEYLAPHRGNNNHQQAYNLLLQLGYSAFIITSAGTLNPCSDPDQHLQVNQLDSDNLVFRK